MKLKTLKLTLKSDRPVKEDAAKLRGFFATRFNEYVVAEADPLKQGLKHEYALLHHHINVAEAYPLKQGLKHVDKLLYRYPRIQYKIIEGTAVVLGIEEGA